MIIKRNAESKQTGHQQLLCRLQTAYQAADISRFRFPSEFKGRAGKGKRKERKKERKTKKKGKKRGRINIYGSASDLPAIRTPHRRTSKDSGRAEEAEEKHALMASEAHGTLGILRPELKRVPYSTYSTIDSARLCTALLCLTHCTLSPIWTAARPVSSPTCSFLCGLRFHCLHLPRKYDDRSNEGEGEGGGGGCMYVCVCTLKHARWIMARSSGWVCTPSSLSFSLLLLLLLLLPFLLSSFSSSYSGSLEQCSIHTGKRRGCGRMEDGGWRGMGCRDEYLAASEPRACTYYMPTSRQGGREGGRMKRRTGGERWGKGARAMA